MSDALIPEEAAARPSRIGRAPILLWIAMLGAPTIWFIQFGVIYALPVWICAHGHHWILPVTAFAFLLLILAIGWLAWMCWQNAGLGSAESELGDELARSRFMSMLGILSTAMFGMLIIWQTIPMFIIHPCYR